MKKVAAILILINVLGSLPALSRDNSVTDSLKLELAKCRNREDSVFYLCRLAWRTGDDKPQEKKLFGLKALETADGIKDKTLLSEAYDAVASGYRANEEYDLAKKYFKLSYQVAEENQLYRRMGYSSYHLAKLALNDQDYDEMFRYIDLSRQNFVKTGDKEMLLKTVRIPFQKKIIANNNVTDTLIRNLKWVRTYIEDPDEILNIYLEISKLYNLIGNKKQSLEYVQFAMDLADKTQNIKGLLNAYYFIAAYFRDIQKNYEVALIYYNKIQEIYSDAKKEGAIASIYNDIGRVYKLMENDSLAMDYFNKSLEISTMIKNRHNMSDAYQNLGDIYFHSRQYDKALKYYHDCYETGCDWCAKIVFHPALINMGQVYLKSDDLNNALKYFQKSLALADSFNADYQRSTSYKSLANYYELQKDSKKAELYYNNAYQTALKSNSLELQQEITDQISSFYSSTGNYKKAYSFLELNKTLVDSLEKINKSDNLARLEMRFEFQNLQMQKEVEKAQSDKEIARQKILRNVFISGLILIGLVGFLLYLGYRRKKKDNLILNEQKQAIESMSKKVHQADQAKLQFFTNVSHELRTPLTIILGMTDKLKSSANENQVVKVIRRNSLKLMQLINHLLDLRKLDAAKMNLTVKDADLITFIKGIISSFEEYANQKNITIHFECQDTNLKGYFDQDKLEKILSNLISNAIKYNRENGTVMITVENVIDGFLKVEVKDSGIGISNQEINNIFNRFYRVADNNSHGSGIGLALTKELIELHKGEISVSSIVDVGTSFIIRFPVDRNHYTEEELIQKENSASTWNYVDILDIEQEVNELKEPHQPDPDKKTILIVEDNSDLRMFIANIFSEDFEILEAPNGEEGYKLSHEYVPDIIISDIIMPKLTGIQMVEKIKGNVATSHIPVVLLTAKNDIGTRLQSFDNGADDYICKPFDSAVLKSRIENLLRQRKQLVEKFSKQYQLEPREVTIEDADQKFLEKTINTIEKYISNPGLNIDLLSLELGVSRTQLYRKLKALTDYSANQFIRIIRLKRAAQILQRGQNNIAEVMDATGFSNYSYFNNCFKEYFGEYPKDYALLSVKGSVN